MGRPPRSFDPRGPFGLGCAQLGGLFTSMSDADAADVVDAAWSAGVRYFDTAPHYGAGESERRLGAALVGRARDSWMVSTKVGRLIETDERTGVVTRRWDFSRDGVLRCLDGSRDRLGIDHLDVVLLHDPQESDEPVRARTTGLETLLSMRDAGEIGALGIGTAHLPTVHDFIEQGAIDVVLLPGRWTLLDHRRAEPLLEQCADTGVQIIGAGAFNSGVLATDHPPQDAKYEYQDAPADILTRAHRLAAVCERFGVRLPQAALVFAAAPAVIGTLLIGAERGDQIVEAVALARASVPGALWDALVDEGMLTPRARWIVGGAS